MNVRELFWHSGSHSFFSPGILWFSKSVILNIVLHRPCINGSQAALICAYSASLPSCNMLSCFLGKARQQLADNLASGCFCHLWKRSILSNIKQPDHRYWYCCTLAMETEENVRFLSRLPHRHFWMRADRCLV